jgi:hypothetical protein
MTDLPLALLTATAVSPEAAVISFEYAALKC